MRIGWQQNINKSKSCAFFSVLTNPGHPGLKQGFQAQPGCSSLSRATGHIVVSWFLCRLALNHTTEQTNEGDRKGQMKQILKKS